MKTQVLLILILFLFCACQQKTIPKAISKSPINTLIVKSLSAINLSETTTGNDEILLSIDIFQQKNKELILRSNRKYEVMNFTQLNTPQSILDTIPLDKQMLGDLLIVSSIIELDEENSENKVRAIVKKELSKGIFLNGISQDKLDTLFGFDDCLGIQYFKAKEIGKDQEKELIFKGRQLLDKFEYRLSFIGL